MKLDIDIRSAVIGLILAVVLLLSVGATRRRSCRHGRYQLILTESHAFIFDSTRGEVWQKGISTYSCERNTAENAKVFFAPKM